MSKITKIIISVLLSCSILLNETISYAQSINSDSVTIADTSSVEITTELEAVELKIEEPAAGLETVPGEVLVIYEEIEEPEQFLSDLVDGELSDISIASTEVIAEDIGEDEKEVVLFEVEDDSQTQELIDLLNEQEGVKAQPNYIYHTFEDPELYQAKEDAINVYATTNDPSAEKQYYLNAYSETESSGASVYEAWDTIKVEKSVTVAVLDTGCDISHPDLEANIDTKHMWDVYNESSNMLDGDGHGTHVCGIVGAVADNKIGIAGASYNANVLPIKIFDDKGEDAYTSSIVEAYEYLGDLIESGQINDLRVINMSLGGYGELTGYDELLEQTISYFRDEYGILTVAAGGNGEKVGDQRVPRTDYCIPSDLDCVLSVTCLDENGGNTVWSDYNIYKDISAPGKNIYSTYHNSGYATMSGTSMAAPLVSGIVALLFAAGPDVTPDDVVDAIKSTAHPMTGKENDRGDETGSAGAIDAAEALKKLMENFTESDQTEPGTGEESDPTDLETGTESDPIETDKAISVVGPTVENGLVYNDKLQQEIPEGDGYELSGQVGDTYQIGKLIYRVTASSEKTREVSVVKPLKNTNKKLTIPATVKINGDSYKVTQIDKKAFYKNKKLTQIVIGKNVTLIGKQAFFGSSKLKKIDIKTNKLKKIGTKAFAKLSKKVRIYVPKKKVKDYTAKIKKAKTIKDATIVKKK